MDLLTNVKTLVNKIISSNMAIAISYLSYGPSHNWKKIVKVMGWRALYLPKFCSNFFWLNQGGQTSRKHEDIPRESHPMPPNQ